MAQIQYFHDSIFKDHLHWRISQISQTFFTQAKGRAKGDSMQATFAVDVKSWCIEIAIAV